MISIESHNGLPIEYESFLIEKYQSFFTTCRYVEVYYPTYDINYMLVFDGCLIDLLMFGNIGNTSRCLNSVVNIDKKIITECIKKEFEKYPSIQKVIVDASYKKYTFNKAILYSKCHDHIINLPATMDDYYLMLGHSTRKSIKKSKSKLLRNYPSANFIVKLGTEIDEDIIDKIMKLNIDRMKQKGIIYGNDDHNRDNIYRYAQYYGCVSYLEINGKVIAGNISYILNKSLFGYIVGHDSDFSSYSAGKICQLYEIEMCIEKGLSKIHLLWGDNEYKKRLLGRSHLMFSYQVYRKYSFDYFFTKIRTLNCQFVIRIRQSELMRPLRNTIKLYRSWVWKHHANSNLSQ